MRRLPAAALAAAGALWVVAGSAAWAEATSREARVAGQFYPANPAELRGLVTELLGSQPRPAAAHKPRILIVPHAGYSYSGPIAASGFRLAQGHAYDGVVVVGFTHRGQFPGSSVDTQDAYETPLGVIPVDRDAVAFLQGSPGIGHVEEAHEAGEHSLEVELPFLQVALPGFRLVPILIGNAELEDARRLADALAELAARGDYLFVFSTDLSHYHPYDEARALDEGTVNAILFETPQAAHRLFAAGELEACGRGPILTSLLLAARLGYPERQLVQYANSGDTAGDRSRVVGYAAIAMRDRTAEAAPVETLSPEALRAYRPVGPEAGQALVAAARQALQTSLASGVPAPQPALDRHPELSRSTGLFVTLRKAGALRGCIGRIEGEGPLAKLLPEVALDAALRDGRFQPVAPEELSQLHIEVSVLTPPVKLARLGDLVAGRDGVILEHQGRHGVFLPQVWEETGWTRLEFLRELASQKAGLAPDAWKQATLYVFQDQTFEEPR
ncbi:MAG: AmmeMemoRadiSam system protein B [Candidatus Omnitrophica bacterium]|nr:AmmeMemoRadiSam system protein B [Candidatus Omnitrophota bacterium]